MKAEIEYKSALAAAKALRAAADEEADAVTKIRLEVVADALDAITNDTDAIVLAQTEE